MSKNSFAAEVAFKCRKTSLNENNVLAISPKWTEVRSWFFFCMWLGICNYNYMIQSFHLGVISHKGLCQKYFPKLNLQYFKTELSYDGNFLHVVKHLWKEQNDSVISSNFQSDSWVLAPKFSVSIRLLDSLHKMYQKWLDLLTLFFA